jgi:hypothetical protein
MCKTGIGRLHFHGLDNIMDINIVNATGRFCDTLGDAAAAAGKH